MNINFYKKIIVGSILCGLIFNPSIFRINKALATGAPVFDVAAITQRLALAGKEQTKEIIVTMKKLAGQMLKKLVLDRIVDATVEWIKRGGFEGKGGPIIQDWGAFFQQATEDYIGEVIGEAMPMLCSPFQLNMAVSFGSQPQKFSQKVECTLGDVTENIDDFFENFEKKNEGRWIAYNQIWEPQNNFFGSALMTRDEMESGNKSILDQKNVEATVNLGFKPQVKCSIDQNTKKEVCVTITPGSVIGKSIQEKIIPNYKSEAILSANDIASYIGALADAVIYRYSILAKNGLVGLMGYNSSDVRKEAGTIYTDFYQDTFSQIDQITFDNNKAMYLDEINSSLIIKTNTINTITQAINVQGDLVTSLEPLDGCVIDPLVNPITLSQQTKLAMVSIEIANIDVSIFNLESKESQLDYEIEDLESIKSQIMNFETSEDEQQMFFAYSALKNSGILDIIEANNVLNESLIELASIQENADILLNTDSNLDPGGYKDLIEDIVPICETNATVPTSE
jgi:hypothetical protein